MRVFAVGILAAMGLAIAWPAQPQQATPAGGARANVVDPDARADKDDKVRKEARKERREHRKMVHHRQLRKH